MPFAESPPMLRFLATAIAALLLSPLSHAQQNNCAVIQAQIEAKIRSSGVASFTLQIVDAETKLADRVVGTCDLGTKKIVYSSSNATTSASAQSKATTERILTECKDGSITYGECKK